MKFLFSLLLALTASAAFGQTTMCAATSAAACTSVKMGTIPYTKTYQAAGTTTAGAGSCVMSVEGTNDNTNYDVIGTITLTLGVTSTSDSFTSADKYSWVRGNPTTLTGTGASCTLIMGN